MLSVMDLGIDNNEVEKHLNAQAPSFLSHVRIVVAKREHVEREAWSVGALKDEVHVEDEVSCQRREGKGNVDRRGNIESEGCRGFVRY